MTNCHLCGHDIDIESADTVVVNPQPVLYRHSGCDAKLEQRHQSKLCMTCGVTPQGLDRETCSNCGVGYCDADRKYMNF